MSKLSAAGWAALLVAVAAPAVHGKGLQLRAPETPGYALHPTKDGGYTYEEEGWRVAIAPDGGVRFVDRNVLFHDLRLGPFKFIEGHDLGVPSLQSFLRDPARPYGEDPWEARRNPISREHADPRAACLERDACYFVPMSMETSGPSASGLLDLTDAYMRWMRQDPYRRAKAQFLAATQDLRIKMAMRRNAALMRASVAEMPSRLTALWQDMTRAPVEKRQLLWQLWTEATDPQSGPRVRATIEAFIRERLPRGSADAFTDAELARFGPAFAPYGDAMAPAPVPAPASPPPPDR